MRWVAPAGPVYQAGTLAGHPVAMAAGLATLKILKRPGTYTRLNRTAAHLQSELSQQAQRLGVPVASHQIGGLLSLFFTDKPPTDATQARQACARRYGRYFRKMLAQGVYLPPSAFEAWFLSIAHEERHIRKTVFAHTNALRSIS